MKRWNQRVEDEVSGFGGLCCWNRECRASRMGVMVLMGSMMLVS